MTRWVTLLGIMSWNQAGVTILVVLLLFVLVVWLDLLPDRGLQDRLAGICLIPRG